METIRFEEWERKDTYRFFSGMSNPFYMVTFREDITGLYRYVKANGLSFYLGMIWACTEALNGVAAFRTAMRVGEPVLLSRRDPSFTDVRPGSESFRIITMEHIPKIDDFCREAEEKRRTQDVFIEMAKETDSLIYYSSLPWIELTALTNERDFRAPGALDDNIPRIAWGRYTEENGRKKIHISMEVNHRFIDGIHIGQFAKGLGRVIRELEQEAEGKTESHREVFQQ